jgi:S-DNA-T family DNA segregation ATPase FtsK/SpoIIIE
VSVTPGPVITLYELVPASGVKISRIVSLADDLALALAAKGIRIMAPIPGKSAVGVEIPNRNPSVVSLRSVLNSSKFRESKAALPVALGKGISGEVVMDDLSKMPHLLIAGATGSGKSVGINTLMASLLFSLHPSDVKFVIIDPKKIELTQYAKLKHHYLAVSPDIRKEIITTPEDSVSVLKSVELEMEQRYDRLASAGVRSIQDYNDRLKSGRLRHSESVVNRKIPFLIVVIDELADLMLTAAREVEEPIARLAQLARAVGIHLVLATQRPSVDVITGVIKANFPARIAYQVSSKIDSRTILDMNGADTLLGSGDMLYLPAGSPKPSRIQNAFISGEEIDRLTDYITKQEGYSTPYMLPSVLERKRSTFRGASDRRDDFFEEAARLIVRHQQGSVSLLQRRLKVGYSRAARLVDELEMAGIVGPYDGSKAREVLVDSDAQLDDVLRNLDR